MNFSTKQHINSLAAFPYCITKDNTEKYGVYHITQGEFVMWIEPFDASGKTPCSGTVIHRDGSIIGACIVCRSASSQTAVHGFHTTETVSEETFDHHKVIIDLEAKIVVQHEFLFTTDRCSSFTNLENTLGVLLRDPSGFSILTPEQHVRITLPDVRILMPVLNTAEEDDPSLIVCITKSDETDSTFRLYSCSGECLTVFSSEVNVEAVYLGSSAVMKNGIVTVTTIQSKGKSFSGPNQSVYGIWSVNTRSFEHRVISISPNSDYTHTLMFILTEGRLEILDIMIHDGHFKHFSHGLDSIPKALDLTLEPNRDGQFSPKYLTSSKATEAFLQKSTIYFDKYLIDMTTFTVIGLSRNAPLRGTHKGREMCAIGNRHEMYINPAPQGDLLCGLELWMRPRDTQKAYVRARILDVNDDAEYELELVGVPSDESGTPLRLTYSAHQLIQSHSVPENLLDFRHPSIVRPKLNSKLSLPLIHPNMSEVCTEPIFNIILPECERFFFELVDFLRCEIGRVVDTEGLIDKLSLIGSTRMGNSEDDKFYHAPRIIDEETTFPDFRADFTELLHWQTVDDDFTPPKGLLTFRINNQALSFPQFIPIQAEGSKRSGFCFSSGTIPSKFVDSIPNEMCLEMTIAFISNNLDVLLHYLLIPNYQPRIYNVWPGRNDTDHVDMPPVRHLETRKLPVDLYFHLQLCESLESLRFASLAVPEWGYSPECSPKSPLPPISQQLQLSNLKRLELVGGCTKWLLESILPRTPNVEELVLMYCYEEIADETLVLMSECCTKLRRFKLQVACEGGDRGCAVFSDFGLNKLILANPNLIDIQIMKAYSVFGSFFQNLFDGRALERVVIMAHDTYHCSPPLRVHGLKLPDGPTAGHLSAPGRTFEPLIGVIPKRDELTPKTAGTGTLITGHYGSRPEESDSYIRITHELPYLNEFRLDLSFIDDVFLAQLASNAPNLSILGMYHTNVTPEGLFAAIQEMHALKTLVLSCENLVVDTSQDKWVSDDTLRWLLGNQLDSLTLIHAMETMTQDRSRGTETILVPDGSRAPLRVLAHALIDCEEVCRLKELCIPPQRRSISAHADRDKEFETAQAALTFLQERFPSWHTILNRLELKRLRIGADVSVGIAKAIILLSQQNSEEYALTKALQHWGGRPFQEIELKKILGDEIDEECRFHYNPNASFQISETLTWWPHDEPMLECIFGTLNDSDMYGMEGF